MNLRIKGTIDETLMLHVLSLRITPFLLDRRGDRLSKR